MDVCHRADPGLPSALETREGRGVT